jgi:hypothetical protein
MVAEVEVTGLPSNIRDQTLVVLKQVLKGLESTDHSFSMAFIEVRKLVEAYVDHILPLKSASKLAEKIDQLANADGTKVSKLRHKEYSASIDFLRRNGNEAAHEGMNEIELSVVWDMLCHLKILLSCLKEPVRVSRNAKATCSQPHIGITIAKISYSDAQVNEAVITWFTPERAKITLFQIGHDETMLQRKFATKLVISCDSRKDHKIKLQYQCSCGWWSSWSNEYSLEKVRSSVQRNENAKDPSEDAKCDGNHLPIVLKHIKRLKNKDEFPIVWKTAQAYSLITNLQLSINSVPSAKQKFEKDISCRLDQNIENKVQIRYQCSCKEWSDWSNEYLLKKAEETEDSKKEESDKVESKKDEEQTAIVKETKDVITPKANGPTLDDVATPELKEVKAEIVRPMLSRKPPENGYCYIIAKQGGVMTCKHGQIILIPQEENNQFQLWKLDNDFLVCKANNLVIDIQNYSFFGSALKYSMDLLLYNRKESGNENQKWSLGADGVIRSHISPFEIGALQGENGIMKLCAVRPSTDFPTRFYFLKE